MKTWMLALWVMLHGHVWAMAPVALQGVVRSQAEGPMEGVEVSAQRSQSTITVSVVSNREGQYQFPMSRLPAGHHELPAALSVQVSGERAQTADLALQPVQDISGQKIGRAHV